MKKIYTALILIVCIAFFFLYNGYMTPEIWISVGGVVISALTAFIVSSMKIGEYKNKVDTLETTIGKDEHAGMRKTMGDCKTEVDKLLEFKTSATKFIDSNIYKNNSPLDLTDFGKKLVKDSGFETIFETTKDDLADKLLKEKNPKTKYDTQEMARALLDELTEYPAFQPIKKYAFEHGNDVTQILRAGAILLRDYYLKKHPEITDATGY
ncbi:hypothetical protein A3A05_02730 [Candidatus Nomurabacteria bacterium RIFCSPLOWO2_01_FULL_41_12]|uniref:Uncharacterized protein n=1 Tax=Candidatus Nomurabacteria bacterium RIFCSPLOWO2_01_FULL_41_12 TaxID=1801774 RepID=A0A1F6WVT7_9BACT|nr:MAG: hypothetical protein A3A05_02730 [Candidatus Nomurabacteria bacterium RIFCSPLOWO2_01_FULL_41_12]